MEIVTSTWGRRPSSKDCRCNILYPAEGHSQVIQRKNGRKTEPVRKTKTMD